MSIKLQNKNKSRLQRWSLFLGIGAAIIAFPVLDPLLSQKSATVTVLDLLSIPVTCKNGIAGRERSNLPNSNILTFCGGVYTDLGLFAVVTSGSFNPFFMNRDDIISMWQPNCKYKVWFYGNGSMPSVKAKGTNKISKTIFWSERLETCDA